MAQLHRQRVRTGFDGDGKPLYKWVHGKTIDELNDNIVRTYVEYGLIEGILQSYGKAELLECTRMPAEEQNEDNGTPFREYVENWMSRYKTSLKPTTLKGYRSYSTSTCSPRSAR